MKYSLAILLLTVCLHSTAQTITTIAGDGTAGFSGDGGPAALARLNRPMYGHTDKWGNFYFNDVFNNRIRKIDVAGNISTFAGTGTSGAYPGDGSPATTMPVSAMSFCTGPSGELYVNANHALRKISPGGTVSTFAGLSVNGYSGDGGPATSAHIHAHYPACDALGNIYFFNGNPSSSSGSGFLRKIDVGGIIQTIGGTGTGDHTGDGGPATAAGLREWYTTVDGDGNIYLSHGSWVRKIDAAGIITLFAGAHGAIGYSGDGGPATAATFYGDGNLAADAVGNVFVSDNMNHCIRKINRSGVISTVAGTGGAAGFSGDGGPATAATLNGPDYIALLADGSFLICDVFNHRIRKVTSGNHIPAFTGGEVQHITVCHDSSFNLTGTLSIFDADAAQPLLWQVKMAPAHGSVSAIPPGTSTGATVPPTGIINYTPAPGYSGTDSFRVRIDDDISVGFTTVYVDVLPGLPETGISGSDTVCAGDTVFFSSGTAGGVWSSLSSTVSVSASGAVTGLSTGTATITYTLTGPCDELTFTRPIAIMPAGYCATAITEQQLQNQLIISPNPSHGSFTISLPANTNGDIVVTNITGQVVKQLTASGETEVSLDVPAGVYIVAAHTRNGVVRRRVVVRK